MKNFFTYFLSVFILIGIFSCKKDKHNNSSVNPAAEEMDPVAAKESQMKSYFIDAFPTDLVEPRSVEVWFPDEYSEDPNREFPVLYMMDGQNIFHPENAYAGVAWEADNIAQMLIDQEKIEPLIIVGIYNSPKRYLEYMPKKVFDYLPESTQSKLKEKYEGEPISDNYLRFIFEDLKPYLDAEFRTKVNVPNTYIAGSSMGGLISLYGLCEYASIFGKAACVSSHFPIDEEATVSKKEALDAWDNYLSEKLPSPETHKIWFDYGTKTLDATYEPYQTEINKTLEEKGFVEGKSYISKKYEGAEHNEQAWQERFADILIFLAGKEQKN